MKNLYLPVDWKVLEIREDIADHFFIVLHPPRDVSFLDYGPGQFFTLTIPGLGEAPFSVSSSPTRPGLLEMCIRKIGRVTNAVSRLKPGDTVGLRGPLGNGYPLEKVQGRDVLIVAGGLGIVPLRSLIRYVADKPDEHGHLTVLYGANTDKELLFFPELVDLDKASFVTIKMIVAKFSPNSAYHQIFGDRSGFVTDLIPGGCPEPSNTFVGACGPPVFYCHAIRCLLAEKYNKGLIYMSLERRMECGIGKCGHCTVGYRYTCIEGPIFNYWDAFNLPELLEIRGGEPWISS